MPNRAPIPPEILAAAQSLVESRAPEALTMEELARRTGLSRTTLYRRTGGREALLDALQKSGVPVGDRTEARGRILQAARVVFSRAGFTGASTEEIAGEADVGVATIYRHFGDKEGLAAAVLQETAPRQAVREVRFTGDLRGELEGLAERILTGLRDDTPLIRWMLIETLQGGPFLPRVRELLPTRTLVSLTRLFAAHLADGSLPDGDPQLLAQAFAGMVMVFGFIGPVFNNLPVPDPPATARTITELFLHGALASRRKHVPNEGR